MSEAIRLDPDFPPAAASNQDHPKVLSRLLTTPPAAPWEQARVARLDARMGAPLPLPEVTFQLKRLSSWRPGAPGRFAVFYVRSKELRGPFETVETVDGQAVPVAFGRSPARLPRLGDAGLVLLTLTLSGAVLGTSVTLGLRARAESADRLEAVERLASAKLAAAQGYRRSVDQAKQLKAAVGHAAPVGEVLGDFAWVVGAKTPEARLVGLHWRDGVMAIEVRGDPPPFGTIDRRLQRSAKQLRPGVWLWGIGPPSSAALGRPGP